MSDVTRLLYAAAAGDRRAAADLLPLVYDELRKLAAARMADESPGHTLQPTALVHEAYLRLLGPADDSRWDNCGHFFAAAAEAMRRILVDAARRKRREKHGGRVERVELPDVPERDPDGRLLALDDALTRLAAEDPVAARVVEWCLASNLGPLSHRILVHR
jgi:RNA polymerase sigma factor (TIGR02999 family)